MKKVHYAEAVSRLVAYVVDVLLITAITWLLSYFAVLVAVGAEGINALFGYVGEAMDVIRLGEVADLTEEGVTSLKNLIVGLAGGYSLTYIVVGWFYFALQQASKAQATIGMRLLGLKIVDYDNKGISFMRASARYLGHYLSMFILYIGVLMVIWTEKKQALHDFMACTYIVHK